MVVHQPRVEIWEGLDEVLILGVGGRTVYKGKQRDVQPYFEGNGIDFDPNKNPADIVMDTIALRNEELIQAWKESVLHAVQFENTPRKSLVPAFSEATDGPREDAGAARQLVLFFQRAMAKQLSTPVALLVEAVVIALCGLVLGNAMRNFAHKGSYREPYERISFFHREKLLPQLHMYMFMSLGLAAAVAGVAVFGKERHTYFREAQAGMNRGAYFVASVAAALPRVVYASLIFASFLEVMGSLPIPFSSIVGCFFFTYWTYYGIAAGVSVVASHRTAPLIATTLGICMSVFSGFIPFPIWMKKAVFVFYAAQILQLEHAANVDAWAVGGMSDRGYEAGTFDMSWGILALWGVMIHGVAFIVMVSTNRALQR
jgi:hypothetical protein